MSESRSRILLAAWAALGAVSVTLALVGLISWSTAAANVVVVLLGGTVSHLLRRPPQGPRTEARDD